MITAISKAISKTCLVVQMQAVGALIQTRISNLFPTYFIKPQSDREEGSRCFLYLIKSTISASGLDWRDIKSWVMRVTCFDIPSFSPFFRLSGWLLNVYKRYLSIVWETGTVAFVRRVSTYSKWVLPTSVILDRDIATTFSITSHVLRATSSWPVVRKGLPDSVTTFIKDFTSQLIVDLGITKNTNKYIYIYIFCALSYSQINSKSSQMNFT